MQTKAGYGHSLVVMAIAVVLAWTGNLTGLFRSDDIVSANWGILALGTLIALGVVRIFDRHRWVVMRRAQLAHQTELRERRRDAVRARREAFTRRVAFNLATIIQQALKEPSTGPVDEDDPIVPTPAAASG